MSRKKLLMIWLLCMLTAPVLLLAMACQAAFGSGTRALSMAVAYDECGNALFGGARGETISARTGNALIQGRRWAKIAAPAIDAIFGAGHCLANATIRQEP
ncbi:hypothetical protein B7R77_03140 [Ralstonia solanacearum K60]|uniref:Lipoprotein transmembrane n=1 Tax=Ralstonia solanacearum K60 TaxID=1091042 RepID=A0AAP8D3N4_RALSL|nr:hypothetical protein [Ralstonia solanacearum]OYQ12350.1 hypothetical protein B7R77_03140 [Ralstonia solanacearum K60]CCF96551.1 conserved exported hypothetical protein [Ralstonia solanacearum K60]